MARVIPTPQTLASPSVSSSRGGQMSQPAAALQSLLGPTRAGLVTSLATAAQRDFWPTIAPIAAALATPWPEPQLRGTVAPAQLFDADSQTAQLCGVALHYQLRRAATRSSSDDETLVLCLHGFNGSTYSFQAALQGLADAVGGTAVAFDRPPFGLTQRDVTTLTNGRSSLSTEGGAALGVALVQHLAMSPGARVVLVGHSAGAGVALRIADMLPRGVVQGIVLVAPAVPASNDEGFMAQADFGSLLRIGATRAVLALDGPGLAFVRSSVSKRAEDVRATKRIGYGGSKPAPQAAVDAYLAPLRADAWDTASLASFRAFETPSALDVKQLAGMRVLVLQGALDDVVPTPSVRRLADVMQADGVDCTYVELPDVGHLPVEEAPDACVAAISDWLREAPPPTPARWDAGGAEHATVAQ
jgi:pimeloyl-ACP methyl ester carboxylesterase